MALKVLPAALTADPDRLAAPYFAQVLSMDVPVSNADARRDLGWAPRFPSYREGLRRMIEGVSHSG